MSNQLNSEIINYLRDFITEQRWKTLCNVLEQRTRYIAVVLEDIYQPHNASAVLRSCDGFGIQDVHIIENKNKFDPSKSVTIGADQWLTLHRYNKSGINNTRVCYNALHSKGYRIIATSPHIDDTPVDEVDLDQKTAIVFGAEYTGLSEYAVQNADGYAFIPMAGFSESFNISVSAAICLYEISKRLRKSDRDWKLEDNERTIIIQDWLEQSIRESDKIKQRFKNRSQVNKS